MERLDPILFGLIAGIISYIIIYFDTIFENKKLNQQKNNKKCICPLLKPTIKTPLIIGLVVWGSATYFKSCTLPTIEDNSNFEQELLTDTPDFN